MTSENISLGLEQMQPWGRSRFCPRIGLALRGKFYNRPWWRQQRLHASSLPCASILVGKVMKWSSNWRFREARVMRRQEERLGTFFRTRYLQGWGLLFTRFHTAGRASPKADPVAALHLATSKKVPPILFEPCFILTIGTVETTTPIDPRQRSSESRNARPEGWTPGARVPSQRTMPTTYPTQPTGWGHLWQA